MNHYQATLLFTDDKGRSMDVFIDFDETELMQEDALEERAISLAYRQLIELGFNHDPDDQSFLFFKKTISIISSKYI